MESKLLNIEIGLISPSPRNPRKTVSDEELTELAASIKAQGLLQPITVRPTGQDSYEIICGERRWRAVNRNAEESGDSQATIACIVREMNDAEAFDAMITENLQRADVDPIEEAFAFCELIKAGSSVDDIAARFGKSKRFVQERCKLNSLIDPLKKLTTDGIIPIAGAIMLSKLKEELQVKYYDGLKGRYDNFDGVSVEIREISNWITREFMSLRGAMFLEYNEEDESLPPTEEWNTRFEKCAGCCMNTGNAGCLFYSMKGEHNCTDRQCFENKTAAYILSEVEKKADRLIMEGQPIEGGKAVVVDSGEETYGYDNIKRIRKNLLQMIRDKGYMIASPDSFGGICKYYGDDERLPDLLKQGKIVECVILGSAWNLQIDTRYYYVNGSGETDHEEDPVEREARELADKYSNLLSKMNTSANEELSKWCSEKKYCERVGKLTDKEEKFFWSLLILNCGSAFIREFGATEYSDQEKILTNVENNMTEENIVKWQRAFLNNMFYRRFSFDKLSQRAMRECFRLAYPKQFEELAKKYADQFEKRSEKIKLRLEELGYGVDGKKLTGES